MNCKSKLAELEGSNRAVPLPRPLKMVHLYSQRKEQLILSPEIFTLSFCEVLLCIECLSVMSATFNSRHTSSVMVKSSPERETLASGSLRLTWEKIWFRDENLARDCD